MSGDVTVAVRGAELAGTRDAPGHRPGSAGAGDVGWNDLPTADGVGPDVVLGRAGAVVENLRLKLTW